MDTERQDSFVAELEHAAEDSANHDVIGAQDQDPFDDARRAVGERHEGFVVSVLPDGIATHRDSADSAADQNYVAPRQV